MKTAPLPASARPRLRRRTIATLTAAGLVCTLVSTAVAGSSLTAASASTDDPACPEARPVDSLVEGQPVTGLTVSSGTEPDPFSGEFLGVLEDGIAPDLDMLLVRLTSPEIDRVGGIWAGMSGSPVYAADGRLLGAVSYGLAWGSSPVAGVTPAADMQQLLPGTTASGTALRARPGASRVDLPPAMERAAADDPETSSREAASGLRRLPLPLQVSGMSNQKRLNHAAERLDLTDVRLSRSGAAPAGTASAEESAMVAGGNMAASLAHGDFSAVGVGTVTMVCGDQVVGFGHPMMWSGTTSMSMHNADTVLIQEDPAAYPFKVANPTGPVGTVDQDRLAAIKGVLGVLPATATVTTRVVLPSGRNRLGRTHVSLQGFVPDATALGLLANADRTFDGIGEGSSRVRFVIHGVTGDGTPFTLRRTNRYASQWDISYESVFEVADMVWALWDNRFTDVTFTEVRIRALMEPRARTYQLRRVERRVAGSWRTVREDRVMKLRRDSTVRLRLTLGSFRNRDGRIRERLDLVVPSRIAVGSRGRLTVRAGGNHYSALWGSSSFDDLLGDLARAPRHDRLRGQLRLHGAHRTVVRRDSELAGDVVGGRRAFRVRVVR